MRPSLPIVPLTVLMTLLVFASCDQPEAALAPDPPSFSECEDPYMDGCDGAWILEEESYGDNQIQMEISQSESILADGQESSSYYCPETLPSVRFTWRGHAFRISGFIYKTRNDAPIGNVPSAWYSLPNGPWGSEDGKAVVWSGEVKIRCRIFDRRIWLGGIWIYVRAGVYHTALFRGDASETGPGFTSNTWGGTTESWTVERNSEGFWVFNTGDGAADQALEDYFNHGKCTEGWVLVIDGKRKC